MEREREREVVLVKSSSVRNSYLGLIAILEKRKNIEIEYTMVCRKLTML